MPKPTPQHEWLQRFLGEWTYEATAAAPGEEPSLTIGTESVTALGDLWIVADIRGDIPGHDPMESFLSIGYDPAKERFVGNFICNLMTMMWTYEGALDADRRVLTLDTEGPGFDNPAELIAYQDVHEFMPDGTRELRSRCKGPNGEWIEFQRSVYTRKA